MVGQRDLPTVSGAKLPYSASGDSYGRVRVKNHRPSGLPKGAAIVHTWQLLGAYLKCTAEVELPGGVVAHDFFYKREVAKKKRTAPKKAARGHK